MTPQGTYQGRPCRACGDTERYRSSRNCVACHRAKYASRKSDYSGLVLEHEAVWRSTYLALFHEAEFDRRGWRQVEAGALTE